MTNFPPLNIYTPTTTALPAGATVNYGQQLVPPTLGQNPVPGANQFSAPSITDPAVKPDYTYGSAAAANLNATVPTTGNGAANGGLNFPEISAAPELKPMFPNAGNPSSTGPVGATSWTSTPSLSLADPANAQPYRYSSDVTPQAGLQGTGAVGVNPTQAVQAYGAPVIAPGLPKVDLTQPAPPAGVGSTLNVIA